MVKIKIKDEQVARIKLAIIEILNLQSMNYHMITDILEGAFDANELSTVGNCLRVLKKYGYIDDILIDGVRFWERTEKKFDADPPVKVLVPFSAQTHKKVTALAAESGRSRVSVIKELVRSALVS